VFSILRKEMVKLCDANRNGSVLEILVKLCNVQIHGKVIEMLCNCFTITDR